MLTALISAITGLFSAIVPDITKEIIAGRQQDRENESLRLQNELQIERSKLELGARVDEANANAVAEELKAWRDTVTEAMTVASTPTGVIWIDGFNALLRPWCCSVIILLFTFIAAFYVHGVLLQFYAGKIADVKTLAEVIWGSMIGDSIQAVLGFLFGYRSGKR